MLNVGNDNSKFVTVWDVTLKPAFSEKILLADLTVSRKTGNYKTDKETGEVLRDEAGEPLPEREYTHWEGRFCGNAFEPAKALANGQAINIKTGWMDKTTKEVKGRKYTNVYVVITDFELCEDYSTHGEDEPE